MSEKDELMKYALETPGNTNPAVLSSKLDKFAAESGGGGVTPTGTIQITENDTYDVTNYASAEVNVTGGESDFSTATVKLICSVDNVVKCFIPNIQELDGTEYALGSSEFLYGDDAMDNTVILYKGSAVLMLGTPGTLAVTGDIQVIPGIGAIITGDGTITYTPAG